MQGAAANADAWELFETLDARGLATLDHYNAMLKSGCFTSEHVREMLQVRMQQAGIGPSTRSYNVLVSALLLEGDVRAANTVAKEEMKAAGVLQNDATVKRVQASTATLTSARYRRVQMLLTQGTRGIKAADMLVEKLHTRQLAQANVYRAIIEHCAGRPDFESAPHTSRALEWYRNACKRQPHATTPLVLPFKLFKDGEYVEEIQTPGQTKTPGQKNKQGGGDTCPPPLSLSQKRMTIPHSLLYQGRHSCCPFGLAFFLYRLFYLLHNEC